MVASIEIRQFEDADGAAVRRVVTDAFGRDVEADLVERIRASEQYVADMELVAVVDGAIVGHVMVSGTALVHAAGERTIALLAPLAVDPALQRSGVGGALVRAVAAIATSRGEPLIVLEGSPRYYGRLGFVAASEHGIEMSLPDWAPPEAAQVLLLPGYDPADRSLRGRVVYPAAFDGVD